MKFNRFLSLLAVLFFSVSTMGQTIIKQSQSRLIEPKQDVFIKPLVAEIKVENGGRKDYGPYTFSLQEYNISSTDQMTWEILDNMKSNALYKATREAGADVLVAATFHAESDEKGKNMIIEISGFPGQYTNFRTAEKSDKDDDYEWITEVYPFIKTKDIEGKTDALKNNSK